MGVKTGVNAEKIDNDDYYAKSFQLSDYHSTKDVLTGARDLIEDSSNDFDFASRSWVLDRNRSSKQCTERVVLLDRECKINVHFRRHFKTDSVREDTQFSLSKAGAQYRIMSFLGSTEGNSDNIEINFGPVKDDFVPVS